MYFLEFTIFYIYANYAHYCVTTRSQPYCEKFDDTIHSKFHFRPKADHYYQAKELCVSPAEKFENHIV